MTDYKAGKINEKGEYEEGTFYYHVCENLKKTSKKKKTKKRTRKKRLNM